MIGLLSDGGSAGLTKGREVPIRVEGTVDHTLGYCPAASSGFDCGSVWMNSPPERRLEFLLDYVKSIRLVALKKKRKAEPDTVHN
jgi:hypothetical protein